MKTKLILTLTLLAAPIPSAYAQNLQGPIFSPVDAAVPRVLAAEGPGVGNAAVSIGVSFLGAFPTLDLRYARGLGTRFGMDGHVATIGVLQELRLGARYLIIHDGNH